MAVDKKKVTEFLKSRKGKVMGVVTAIATVAASLPVTASAAETSGGSITYWSISEGMLDPLMNSITNNINAAVPYGLAIMGSFIGINVLKRVLYSFL